MNLRAPTSIAVFALTLGLGALTGCAAESTVGEASALDDTAVDVASDALVTTGDLPNVFTVRPGVMRGGRPSVAGYIKLKALGIKTIIDLETADLVEANQAAIDSDRANATAAGMRWVHIPMQAFTTGLSARFDAKVNQALAVLKNHGRGGVYLHCKHGRDRTGLVMALDRVENEGWAADRAYDEMIARGFRTYFVGMKSYFERRTGYDD